MPQGSGAPPFSTLEAHTAQHTQAAQAAARRSSPSLMTSADTGAPSPPAGSEAGAGPTSAPVSCRATQPSAVSEPHAKGREARSQATLKALGLVMIGVLAAMVVFALAAYFNRFP